jgi:Domain of unknown function (DUF5659)
VLQHHSQVKITVNREQQTSYATDHLYLAAFLVCTGYRVIGTRADSHNRISFLFHASPELLSAAAQFLAGGQVDARQFSFELLKLKKLLPKRH